MLLYTAACYMPFLLAAIVFVPCRLQESFLPQTYTHSGLGGMHRDHMELTLQRTNSTPPLACDAPSTHCAAVTERCDDVVGQRSMLCHCSPNILMREGCLACISGLAACGVYEAAPEHLLSSLYSLSHGSELCWVRCRWSMSQNRGIHDAPQARVAEIDCLRSKSHLQAQPSNIEQQQLSPKLTN